MQRNQWTQDRASQENLWWLTDWIQGLDISKYSNTNIHICSVVFAKTNTEKYLAQVAII